MASSLGKYRSTSRVAFPRKPPPEPVLGLHLARVDVAVRADRAGKRKGDRFLPSSFSDARRN